MEAFIDWMWNDAFAVWFFAVPATLLVIALAVYSHQSASPRDASLFVCLSVFCVLWLMLMAFLFGSFWLVTTYPLQTFIFLAVGLGAAFVWCGLCLFAGIVTKLLS